MGKLRPQIVPHLVAYDGDIAAEFVAAGQQGGGAGQRLQPFQMDAIKRLVEDFLRFTGTRAEQAGENVAQRTVRAAAHFECSPWRLAERRESVMVALDDGRPGIDQRVVPVEQDGARRPQAGRQRHVTASPDAAKRTYSSRSRRAVGPTLPSPTGSPSIFTTGVTNEVALVMNASLAFFASASVNGRSTNLS